jgi:transcriptional regulator with XRE-family HTH domain
VKLILDRAVGKRIRTQLPLVGMNQVGLARQLGMDPSRLSRVLNGHVPVEEDFPARVANLLRTTVEALSPAAEGDLEYLLERRTGQVADQHSQLAAEAVQMTVGRTALTSEVVIDGFTAAIDAVTQLLVQQGRPPPDGQITILGDTKESTSRNLKRSMLWARGLQCAMYQGWPVRHVVYREPAAEWLSHWLLDRLGFDGSYDVLPCETGVAERLYGVVVHSVGAFLFTCDRDDAGVFGKAVYSPAGHPLYVCLHEHALAVLERATPTIRVVGHADTTRRLVSRLDAVVYRPEALSKKSISIVKQGLCLALEPPEIVQERARRAAAFRPACRDTVMQILADRTERWKHFTSSASLRLITTEEAFLAYSETGRTSLKPDDELDLDDRCRATRDERMVVLEGYQNLLIRGRLELFFADRVDPPLESLFESIYWEVMDSLAVFVAFRQRRSILVSETRFTIESMRKLSDQLAANSSRVGVEEFRRLLKRLMG